MSKINWKEIAKDNNMDYHEFGSELIDTTLSYMMLEMKRNNSNEMEITKDDINVKLTCRVWDDYVEDEIKQAR